MSHERWHVIEKIQVQVAAVAALALVYAVAWRLVWPRDVSGTFALIATGRFGALAATAVLVWVLAAACAVLTVSARAEGAVLATLLGVMGLSMRSAPIRLLVIAYGDSPGRLMVALAVEIACLAVILLGALAIIGAVRAVLLPICPTWLRPGRADQEDDSQGEPSIAQRRLAEESVLKRMANMALGIKPSSVAQRPSPGDRLTAIVGAFGITLLVGWLLLIVTLREAQGVERGQILAALASSFLLSALLADQLMPARLSLPHLAAPLVLAVGVYLHARGLQPAGPLTWLHVPDLATALPIDWLCAGCGGAVGGYWISSRIREARHATAAAETAA
ncbi:MAG: hypothetical protein GX591_04120 [Planctomycetes bacterium]|nr:hypothetical protein [Planctomycetota bacterium]